jgi:hypothetical protein
MIEATRTAATRIARVRSWLSDALTHRSGSLHSVLAAIIRDRLVLECLSTFAGGDTFFDRVFLPVDGVKREVTGTIRYRQSDAPGAESRRPTGSLRDERPTSRLFVADFVSDWPVTCEFSPVVPTGFEPVSPP